MTQKIKVLSLDEHLAKDEQGYITISGEEFARIAELTPSRMFLTVSEYGETEEIKDINTRRKGWRISIKLLIEAQRWLLRTKLSTHLEEAEKKFIKACETMTTYLEEKAPTPTMKARAEDYKEDKALILITLKDIASKRLDYKHSIEETSESFYLIARELYISTEDKGSERENDEAFFGTLTRLINANCIDGVLGFKTTATIKYYAYTQALDYKKSIFCKAPLN